jgi:hypothetical protein
MAGEGDLWILTAISMGDMSYEVGVVVHLSCGNKLTDTDKAKQKRS